MLKILYFYSAKQKQFPPYEYFKNTNKKNTEPSERLLFQHKYSDQARNPMCKGYERWNTEIEVGTCQQDSGFSTRAHCLKENCQTDVRAISEGGFCPKGTDQSFGKRKHESK